MTELDEKSWLSEIFQSLNVAKLANFSIPKRIYLNLSDRILGFDRQRIGNIIDTRGLDLATKDRRDLAEYIRESDESICIFTERFPSAPANVIQIISIDLGVEIETILSDRVLAPRDYDESIFWQQAIDRWGQGSGYKVDVLSLYIQQVGGIDRLFVDLIQTAWNERIIQPILAFLGDR
ncbi:hypothetical protein [Chamaesiphon sp. GL140_3_metabinner_50]|uniref:hypothetical protein n=1 Tax=Chamaesiphon sp. GL140_3_metabinner_50 TaxID=2970812 RepID=UPI0025EADE8A|nr:hypothetical protein [Chamaesiphon sp. GL140_3_metabinner_50]